MPNSFNFDVLPNYFGWTTHRCIEKDCGYGGPKWEMDDEKMEAHYLTHYREPEFVVNMQGMEYEVQGEIRIQPCRNCGKDFSQIRRRGRPQLDCDSCKSKASTKKPKSLIETLDDSFSVYDIGKE